MTTDIVNEVANELGITVTNIIPELTKLKIMQNAFGCCVCAFIALIFLVITIREIRKEDPDDTISICCIAIFVCMFIATLYFGYELANWLTSPQIKAMRYILNQIR